MGRKENKPGVKGKELDSCGKQYVLYGFGVAVPCLLAPDVTYKLLPIPGTII